MTSFVLQRKWVKVAKSWELVTIKFANYSATALSLPGDCVDLGVFAAPITAACNKGLLCPVDIVSFLVAISPVTSGRTAFGTEITGSLGVKLLERLVSMKYHIYEESYDHLDPSTLAFGRASLLFTCERDSQKMKYRNIPKVYWIIKVVLR